MRILVLIIQFPPDVNAAGHLMAQLCEELQGYGCRVSVATSFPHYEKFRVWDEYRGKLVERSAYRGMEVVRHYVHASGSKRRIIDRFMSYFSVNVLTILTTVSSRQSWDVILCSNGSFLAGITASVISKIKSIDFILNVQDLYPATPIETGQIRNRWIIVLLQHLERFMYARAAHITVITPSFQDHLLRKGVPREKISVIPNFVDTDFILPLPKVSGFSRLHGIADRFVVTHAGNIGYVYDLATLLDAALLLTTEQDILFLIVGDGVMKPSLEDKAARLHLPNVRFLPFQPREALPQLRAASDVQVSLYRHGSAKHSMPSKIYEIMASGRPLLASADRDSDVWRLVQETKCGVCIEPQDAPKLAAAILALYRDRAACAAMGARGRTVAERTYSRHVVAAQYYDLLKRVATRRDRGRRAGGNGIDSSRMRPADIGSISP